MGTICILLGLICFIGSIIGGFALTRWYLGSQWVISLEALPKGNEMYVIIIGICGVIGLLICLNLVMNGLIYNKLSKLAHRKSGF